MDQKNTIVKCKAHPNCLFNHNEVCDNYVITIGEDCSCECYVETENEYDPPSTQEILEYTIKLEQEKLRGQRAKGDFLEDSLIDPEIVNEVCKSFSDWDEASTPDICKTCKKNPHNNKCPWKDVAYGIWTCYEEVIDEI